MKSRGSVYQTLLLLVTVLCAGCGMIKTVSQKQAGAIQAATGIAKGSGTGAQSIGCDFGQFTAQVAPIVSNLCLTCHGGQVPQLLLRGSTADYYALSTLVIPGQKGDGQLIAQKVQGHAGHVEVISESSDGFAALTSWLDLRQQTLNGLNDCTKSGPGPDQGL